MAGHKDNAGRLREDHRVTQALRGAGLHVTSVFDLVNSKESYAPAIPILLHLLQEGIADDWIAQGAVRALAVREARGIAAPPLIRLFEDLPETKGLLKWAIGNTLSIVATSDDLEDLLGLAVDTTHGISRQMIVWALGRFRRPEVVKVLMGLLADQDVAAHAVHALGKQRAAQAIPVIEERLIDCAPLFRKEAHRALKKLRESL